MIDSKKRDKIELEIKNCDINLEKYKTKKQYKCNTNSEQ